MTHLKIITFRASPYCPPDAKSYLAEPEDLVIICGEQNIQVESHFYSAENELLLRIKEIINNPRYDPARMNDGYDIAVYIVDDTDLKNSSYFNRDNIWPACLPREDKEYVSANGNNEKGYVSGWDIGNFRDPGFVVQYLNDRFNQKQMQMEKVDCTDITYNGGKTNTYYPPRSRCFRSPTYETCPNFGTSGSGIVRRFKGSGYQKYSFQGPMSFHRGCVDIDILDGTNTNIGTVYQSYNPTVFSEAVCYLEWIAQMYGMNLPDDFRYKQLLLLYKFF